MSWAQQIVGDYAANFFNEYPSKVGYGYTNVEARRRFGFNANIVNTERSIWPGADGAGNEITSVDVNYLASATSLKFVSTDANDTSGGSGARQMSISGLDQDGFQSSTSISTNGQTPVDVPGQWIENAFRMKVGAHTNRDAVCVGTLFLFSGTATDGIPDDETKVYAIVMPGKNQTLQCSDTIPIDKVGFLRWASVSSFGNANAVATTRVIVRPQGGVWETKDQDLVTRGNLPLEVGELLPPLSSVEIRGERTSGSGNIDVSAKMFMWLAPIRT